jgi:hypothetical protein
MEDKSPPIYDKELYDKLYEIRSTMQTVQMQFEIMNQAVEKCGKMTAEDLMGERIGCIGAVNAAHKEILLFLELKVKLARLIDDLRAMVLSKCL